MLGNLSISLMDKKPGMLQFAEALVKAGKSVPIGRLVGVEHIMPSTNTVTSGVKEGARILRHELSSIDLKSFLEIGGGVSNDELKQKSTGKNTMTLSYIYFPQESRIQSLDLKALLQSHVYCFQLSTIDQSLRLFLGRNLIYGFGRSMVWKSRIFS